mmetsp:Transcript_59309/g.139686  ORF Transcript_59309/g.139686 Transcript_59309/m.139686 type:complete len:563 (+) Transcript_59309:373-2061(+)
MEEDRLHVLGEGEGEGDFAAQLVALLAEVARDDDAEAHVGGVVGDLGKELGKRLEQLVVLHEDGAHVLLQHLHVPRARGAPGPVDQARELRGGARERLPRPLELVLHVLGKLLVPRRARHRAARRAAQPGALHLDDPGLHLRDGAREHRRRCSHLAVLLCRLEERLLARQLGLRQGGPDDDGLGGVDVASRRGRGHAGPSVLLQRLQTRFQLWPRLVQALLHRLQRLHALVEHLEEGREGLLEKGLEGVEHELLAALVAPLLHNRHPQLHALPPRQRPLLPHNLRQPRVVAAHGASSLQHLNRHALIMPMRVVQGRSPDAVDGVVVDLGLAAQEEVEHVDLAGGGCEMQGCALVVVGDRGVDAVDHERLHLVHVADRGRLAHMHARVEAHHLAPCLEQQLLHRLVLVPHRVLQRRAVEPVPRIHVRLLREQELNRRRVSVGRREVQRRAGVIVPAVNVHSILEQALHLLQVPRRGRPAHLDRARAPREDERVARTPATDDLGGLVVLVPDGIVQRRVLLGVLECRVRVDLEQELHDARVPLRGRDVERSAVVGVGGVDAGAA